VGTNPVVLPSPDSLNPLVVHVPSRSSKKCGDSSVAVAPELAGKLDDCGGQRALILSWLGGVPLYRAILIENPTRPTL